MFCGRGLENIQEKNCNISFLTWVRTYIPLMHKKHRAGRIRGNHCYGFPLQPPNLKISETAEKEKEKTMNKNEISLLVSEVRIAQCHARLPHTLGPNAVAVKSKGELVWEMCASFRCVSKACNPSTPKSFSNGRMARMRGELEHLDDFICCNI